ncbi:ATP-dependent DNA helicase DinG [Motiliproteus sp. MSK22-1]|nr:ATP-dependent DNA helicase DinG [Motiliproteus sp. MSK22-1]OMH38793.1 ATP-dependent DNA helicase DinG [Motiliproteus sp. MSK22-1]
MPEALKQEVQQAYSHYIESKEYRARYGQRLMIAEIVKGLMAQDESTPAISVVEAGTGTGKTVAYLLAALPVAKHLGKKLVVSTATIALQEQIVLKDLPDLAQHSGMDFSYELVKGRGRYLCLSKLDMLLQNHESQNPSQALYEDELDLRLDDRTHTLYQDLGESYAKGDWDGERDSWPKELDDQDWRPVTTDHRQCTNRRCSHFSGCCFFRSRQGLDKADCIVANHDLVLSDLALGGGAILPDPQETIYIFDEGHHLSDKALQHFSYRLRLRSTQSWLMQLPKTLGRLVKDLGNPDGLARKLSMVASLSETTNQSLGVLLPAIEGLQQELVADDREKKHSRFAGGVVPEQVRESASQLAGLYNQIFSQLDATAETLKEAISEPLLGISKEGAERWYPTVGRMLARSESALALWRDYAVANPASGAPQARWLTAVDGAEGHDIELACSPIVASETLKSHLWEPCAGAVVTSATLTALGEFQRLIMRTGLPENCRYSRVPSPFDYANAARLNIPDLKASPADTEAHDEAVATTLQQVLSKEDAALVLFTSWRQMLRVQELLAPAKHLEIIAQGMYSKQEVLRQHKLRIDDGNGSVLFGLASFAEGVDLPGEYLTHVVIAKIPFSVPGDPVEAALHEWIRERGGDPFMEISVPDASVKLIQACGRLLRSETDRGQITLLDNRLVTRRYGRALLESLPAFSR